MRHGGSLHSRQIHGSRRRRRGFSSWQHDTTWRGAAGSKHRRRGWSGEWLHLLDVGIWGRRVLPVALNSGAALHRGAVAESDAFMRETRCSLICGEDQQSSQISDWPYVAVHFKLQCRLPGKADRGKPLCACTAKMALRPFCLASDKFVPSSTCACSQGCKTCKCGVCLGLRQKTNPLRLLSLQFAWEH